MFANDKSIDTLSALYKEIKKYVELQGQYFKLDLVEKLTILLSTLIVILLVTIFCMMALFYFSFMLIYILSPHVGGLIASYAIVGIALLVIAGVVYYFRKPLIFQPMINFLAHLFLEEQHKK